VKPQRDVFARTLDSTFISVALLQPDAGSTAILVDKVKARALKHCSIAASVTTAPGVAVERELPSAGEFVMATGAAPRLSRSAAPKL